MTDFALYNLFSTTRHLRFMNPPHV